jgi:radical SAM-linked protein
MWTYRIKYAKRGRVRYISHLDVMRALIRAFYRARLPLAYTEGFNPRPKLTMGPALPLGYESETEFADIALAQQIPPETLQENLKAVLPEGLDLLAAEPVEPSSPRLSNASSVLYMVKLRRDLWKDIEQQIQEFAARDTAPVERVRKDTSDVIDVKHFVKDLGVEGRADFRWLRVEILTGGRGSCSPTEVVQAVLHLSPNEAKCLKIVRTGIRFDGRPLRKNIDAKVQEEEDKNQG